MADTKISALTAVATAALADELAVNEAGTSKKATVQQILDATGVLAASATAALADEALVAQSDVAKSMSIQKILDATGILAASGVAALADEALVAQSDVAKSMSIQKILDAEGLLAAAAAPSAAQTVAISQSSVAKALSLTQLVTYLQTLGMPRVLKLGSQHSISSATATKVTGLDMTLEAGTYTFDYYLIVRSSTAADGVMVGVNFSTGTAAVKTMIAYWADNTAAVTAEVHSMSDQGNKGFGFISGMASKAYTTTTPDMGTTIGVKTTASDTTMRVSGIMIVTVQGNIELWHGSESTNATSVEVGSSLIVIRTA